MLLTKLNTLSDFTSFPLMVFFCSESLFNISRYICHHCFLRFLSTVTVSLTSLDFNDLDSI